MSQLRIVSIKPRAEVEKQKASEEQAKQEAAQKKQAEQEAAQKNKSQQAKSSQQKAAQKNKAKSPAGQAQKQNAQKQKQQNAQKQNAQKQKQQKQPQKPPQQKKKKKVHYTPKPDRIEVLSEDDKKQLTRFKAKWKKVATSTDRINRDRAEKTITAIYAYCNKSKPEIVFLDSPDIAEIVRLSEGQNFYSPHVLLRKLSRELNKAVRTEVGRTLRQELHDYFLKPSVGEFSYDFYDELSQQLGKEEPIDRLDLGMYAYYDFVRKMVEYDKCELEWKLLQTWAKEGAWSFTFEGLCIICDRPTEIVIPKSGKPGTVMLKFANGESF